MPEFGPCTFSPSARQAVRSARFLARMFATGETVLDVGFGQGYFLEQARANGLKPLGLDRDAALADSARARGFQVFAGEVNDLADLCDMPLDGIVAQHLVEHLTPEGVAGFFESAAVRVRPGGLALVVTPNFRDWRVASELFWLDPTHVRPYNGGSLSALADPAKWALEDEGVEPMVITRRWATDQLKRIIYGADYGKSGKWFRFRRRTPSMG